MATPNDIYNEITRIDNAKQGIAEAIEEKGVQVPAGTPIQDFPGKVRQIRQGSETAVEYTPQDLTPEQQAQARTNIGAGTYSKPNAGIPDGDLSQSVQASLEKAESAYQKPGSGIPETDLSQGVQTSLEKADTAVQPAALNEITDLIPEQATPENKLADKNFVNSSIATNTANYISNNGQPFQSVADLEAYTGPLTNNDYAFVVGTDSAGNSIYTRYKYNANTDEWAEEYVLNNSSFTAEQWAAISSGITALLVQKLSTLPTETVLYVAQTLTEAQKQQARTNIGAGTFTKPGAGIPGADLSQDVQNSLGKADTAYQKPNTGIPKTDLATAVQNSLEKADTALQPAALTPITELIPEQATPQNQLADKNFVNSSVATNTANYISDNGQPFQSVADLEAYTGPLTNNDYAFVVGTDSAGNTTYTRYKYNATTQTWAAEYVLNNSSFTAAQWAAISSGITALLVQKLSGLPTEIVTYVSQTLTEAQKQQARTNIGAGTYSKPENGIPNTDLAGKFAGSPTAGGPAYRAFGIPFGDVIAGSTATDIKATVNNFPEELTNGVCAYIRNNIVASASGWTLNVNGTGAKPVYASNADATRTTTVFSASVTYLFIYNETRIEGGCWDMYYGYNANDNTIGYNLRTNTMSLPVTSACYRYRLLFTSADKKQFVPANASSSTNATSKRTTTQTPIDPFGSIRYYSYTTAVSSGNRPGATYLWEQYLLTLGYSFNRTGSALELTPWEPVYIKCAPQPDDSAIIDAETPYVQDLPTSEDGKIYIYLGVATSATQVEVVYYHPVYYHNGVSIVKWAGSSANQIKRVDVVTNNAPKAYILGTQIKEINESVYRGIFAILLCVTNSLKIESYFATLNWEFSVSAGFIIQYKPTSGNYGLLDVSHAADGANSYVVFNGITFSYNSTTDRYETNQWPTS